MSANLLPVDVQIREDAALGAAWRRCQAALPEEWTLTLGDWSAERHRTEPFFEANAEPLYGPRPSDETIFRTASTPTDALSALVDALEARRAAE